MRKFLPTALVAVTLFLVVGCAAGRNDEGDVIVGAKVASLPETAGEFAQKAASFLPFPFNYIVAGVSTLIVGGGGLGIAGVASRASRRREAEAGISEDRAYDEAFNKGLALGSNLVGSNGRGGSAAASPAVSP